MSFQSNQNSVDSHVPTSKQRTLMESLLARKIDMASSSSSSSASGHAGDRRLFRTDSVDSTSSLGSLILGDDVCRCDDCLLGIADLYTIGPAESALARKKVILSAARRSVSLFCCSSL